MSRPLSPAERSVLVAVILAVALVLRVGFVLETHVANPIRADAAHYVQYASNLHERGVFGLGAGDDVRPDSFRSPGYPVFLWLHRAVFGADRLYVSARLSQAVLDTLTVLFAFWLARRVLPFAGALVAAALTALSPHLVANTGYLLTETQTTATLTAALVGLAGFGGGRSGVARALATGAAFSLAVLTNEALAPVPWLLAALVYLRADKPRCPALRTQCLAMLAVCAVAQGGWALRNAVSVAGDAPRGASRALQTISHGTYPDFVYRDPRFRYMPYRDDPEQPRYGEDPGHFWRVFTSRVAERPWRYASWYLLEKPVHLWGFDGLQADREIYTYPASQTLYDKHAAAGMTLSLMRLLHWPLVLLGVLGAASALRWRRDRVRTPTTLLAFVVCIGWMTVVGVVFAPWPRYVMPLRPALFVLATVASWRLVAALARRRPAAAEVGAAAVR
ncbi:MAG: glycosyltransferase family 39 protein [Planctomycetota bacterium]